MVKLIKVHGMPLMLMERMVSPPCTCKCTCNPACSLNMDLPIVFHPVSEIMQNIFNYMHFKINTTIKQKNEKERKK